MNYVLHTINIAAIAGAEKYLLQLLPALKKLDVKVHLFWVYRSKDSDIAQKFKQLLNDNNIDNTSIKTKSWIGFKIYFELYSLYKKQKFTHIHSHLIYADFWSWVLKVFFRIQVTTISCKHGYHEKTYTQFALQPQNCPKHRYQVIYNIAERGIDVSYACSNGLRKFHQSLHLHKAEKMKVVLHGFDYPPLDINFINNISKQKFTISVPGRLIPRKGHKLLFEAIALIANKVDVDVWILGSGYYENEIKNQVESLNLTSKVKFLGYQTNVMEYCAAADLIVIPSYCEGLPLVIFEAFHTQKPCLAFDTIGCNEAIVHKQTGYLAKAFDIKDLAENISNIFHNYSEAKLISNAAFKTLQTYFNLQRMAKETKALYDIYP